MYCSANQGGASGGWRISPSRSRSVSSEPTTCSSPRERSAAGERQLQRALGGPHRAERRDELERDRERARDLGEVLERLGPRAARCRRRSRRRRCPAARAGVRKGTASSAAKRPSGRSSAWPRSRFSAAKAKDGLAPRAAFSITWRSAAGQRRAPARRSSPSSAAARGRPPGCGTQKAACSTPAIRAMRASTGSSAASSVLPGEQVLRGGHGAPQVVEPLAREVALLAQLGEGGAELCRGLGVALDELARPRRRPPGHAGPSSGDGRRRHAHHGLSGGRRPAARRAGGRRARGGARERRGQSGCGRGGLGRRARGRPAEQSTQRLLRPLPGGRRLLDVEDGVAVGQVLDRAREDRGRTSRARPRRARPPPGSRRCCRMLSARSSASISSTCGRSRLLYCKHERHRCRVEVVRDEVLRHLAVALDVLLPAVERRSWPRTRASRRPSAPAGAWPSTWPARAPPAPAAAGRSRGSRASCSGSRSKRIVRSCAELIEISSPRRFASAAAVQDLQVGGLPADRRAVVDQLDLDRAVAVIQLDHGARSAGDASVPARGAPVMGFCTHGKRSRKGEGSGDSPWHPGWQATDSARSRMVALRGFEPRFDG